MSQYWTFAVREIARHMGYANQLADTERFEDAKRVIETLRETVELRPHRPIPL
jgi:hypothetical protein